MAQSKQTAAAHPNAAGMVAIYEGSVMVLAIWAYDVTAVTQNPKAAGIQITIRSGPWFAADVSVGEFMTASASAMQLYIREERMLRSVKTKAA